jgi:mannose-6-phosphate isomerase-like protein (cupin superfamily)
MRIAVRTNKTIKNMSIEKVNLAEKFQKITDHWNPRIAGELNGQLVKLVKFQGEFIWHKHELEDELFLVIAGVLTMELRDKTVTLQAGEFIIIPRGVEHRPSAAAEVEILLFEPASLLNTGDKVTDLTKRELSTI